MTPMLDLLVVGAGLAGLSAALAAAEQGMSVRVVARGMGALHWTAGTLDLLGYLPGNPIAVAAPFEAIDALPQDHPYRQLGADSLRTSLETFRRWMREAGATWRGDGERNMLLPSPAGAVRPAWFAPSAQQQGEILPSAAGGAPMVIVGVEVMRDFYPLLIAENLQRQGYRARAAFVPWNSVSKLRDRNTVQLAQGLEEEKQLEELARGIKPLVKSGERVGLPAILGLDAHERVYATLSEMVGATIFEIPTLPPSVPGTRLHRALVGLLATKGVRVEMNMETVDFRASDGAIEWVETATSARPLRHTASKYLLATGGILGGGLVGTENGVVRETVFGLPLTTPDGRANWFRPLFYEEGGQPVFRGGVCVDGGLRPLDTSGEVVYRNLWAAGGVLGGCDPIVEHSLEGIALSTGVGAARNMSKS